MSTAAVSSSVNLLNCSSTSFRPSTKVVSGRDRNIPNDMLSAKGLTSSTRFRNLKNTKNKKWHFTQCEFANDFSVKTVHNDFVSDSQWIQSIGLNPLVSKHWIQIIGFNPLTSNQSISWNLKQWNYAMLWIQWFQSNALNPMVSIQCFQSNGFNPLCFQSFFRDKNIEYIFLNDFCIKIPLEILSSFLNERVFKSPDDIGRR